jgi:hypothetical protein
MPLRGIHHKPSGQAVVTLSGHDHYLGKWQTPESKAEYDRLVGEWLAKLASWAGSSNSPVTFPQRQCPVTGNR